MMQLIAVTASRLDVAHYIRKRVYHSALLGEIMIYLNVKRPSQADLVFTKQWIKAFPNQFNMFKKEISELAKDKLHNYYMIDIISKLSWYKNLKAKRYMADSLCEILYQVNPEFFVCQNPDKQSRDINLFKLINYCQNNQFRKAI